MSFEILSELKSPIELQSMDDAQLNQLSDEIREALLTVVADRAAHFASNLGVVELCIALHQVFDFSRDRLIWDTGHQIYPHKLITGRFHQMDTIRRRHRFLLLLLRPLDAHSSRVSASPSSARAAARMSARPARP